MPAAGAYSILVDENGRLDSGMVTAFELVAAAMT